LFHNYFLFNQDKSHYNLKYYTTTEN